MNKKKKTQPETQRTVTAKRDWIDLKKGETFILVKCFWRNGEGWHRVKTQAGEIKEFPDVFFL